jgi:hypothetical protein
MQIALDAYDRGLHDRVIPKRRCRRRLKEILQPVGRIVGRRHIDQESWHERIFLFLKISRLMTLPAFAGANIQNLPCLLIRR